MLKYKKNTSILNIPCWMFDIQLLLVVFGIMWLTAGCGSESAENQRALIKIDIGKSNPDRLLKFYFGSYVSEAGAGPFTAGLLVKQNGDYFLNKDNLDEAIRAQLADLDQDNVLVWDELEPFLQSTYYNVRSFAPTLSALQNEVGYKDEEGVWEMIEVDGVMTEARRLIYVDQHAVQSALAGYEENNGALIYPAGTVFVGEHQQGGAVVETTVMKKRGDNFWDFYVYDAQGNLAPATSTKPRALTVPTRCVGCHFGEKKFEPENSYPLPAPPGPGGPRGIYTESSERDTVLVKLLNEHNKRSDTVLGVYGTIYLGQLQRDAKAGKAIDEADRRILEAFGFKVQAQAFGDLMLSKANYLCESQSSKNA